MLECAGTSEDGSPPAEFGALIGALQASGEATVVMRHLGGALYKKPPECTSRILELAVATSEGVHTQRGLLWGAVCELCDTEMAESTLRGVVATLWRGVFEEAGLPPAVVRRHLDVPDPAPAKRK